MLKSEGLKLYLMRHGMVSLDSDSVDFRVSLSQNGIRDVLSQRERFKKSDGIRPDCIFCSTAKRARETADLLDDLFVGAPVFFRDTLYLAPAFRIMDLVRQTDSIFRRIMIIGHTPGLEQLTAVLTSDDVRLRFHPADCVSLRVNLNSWEKLNTGCAEIEKSFLIKR